MRPPASLATLDAAGAPTVLANVDAAGAVLAARGPAVFIDGRTEAYPPALWRDYADLRAGRGRGPAVLARWRPASACCWPTAAEPSRPWPDSSCGDPAWTLRGIDGAAALFLPGGDRPPVDRCGRDGGRPLLARAGRPGMPFGPRRRPLPGGRPHR